jgi:predicted ester cyclase
MTTAPSRATPGGVSLDAFRRLIEEGFSGGDLSVVDEVMAADHLEHQHGLDPPDRQGVKQAIAFLHLPSPDICMSIEDVAVSGDKVWPRLRAWGTHGGEILGGPTGRAFDVTVMDLSRFDNGRIVEHWGVADRFAQMEQLGLIAAPGSPRPSQRRSEP